MPHVKDFTKLSAGGKNALYVKHGKIVNGEDNTKNKSGMKSIDFKWNVETKNGNTITFYATHKHTKDCGGSQDNQFADVRNSLKHFKSNKDENIRYLAIVDGKYYQLKYCGYKNKIQYLRRKYQNKYCRIMCINDLENYIANIYEKY